MTKRALNKLFDNGDISQNDKLKFFRGMRAFYVDAAERALAKLPFDDAVLSFSILKKKLIVLLIQLSIIVINILNYLTLLQQKWINYKRSL